MLAALSEALSRVAEVTSAVSATVVVGSNESVSSYVLPPRLAALKALAPADRPLQPMARDLVESLRGGPLGGAP